MGEKELSDAEIEAYRKEVAEIKNEAMCRELEEIKKERLRKELEEIKKEQQPERQQQRPEIGRRPGSVGQPTLSLSTVIFAALSLLIAGYLAGTLYTIEVTTTINSLLTGYGLPAAGGIVVAIFALLLALLGTGMITIAKK